MDNVETVVLLHGLGLGRWAMWPLARALRKAGYRTVNLGYPSRLIPLEKLGREWLPEALRRQGLGEGRLHFVTHSMGGILVRLYAQAAGSTKIGRVVMIAPPNAGAEIVDHLRGFPPFRWFTLHNGTKLGTGPDAVPSAIGPWPYEAVPLGIIAGDRTFNLFARSWFPGPNDGKVSVENTKLQGMADFLVLHHSHTWLQWSRETARQAIAFLKTGKFAA